METVLEQPTTEMHSECIDSCNKMLRGERSAVETYELAIEKHGTNPRLAELREIAAEHKRSVADLEANIRSMAGIPDETSGAWGAFAKTIQSAANLFGEGSAVEALMKGEEHGLNDYLSLLDSDDVSADTKELYARRLIPRIKSHLMILERLEERID